MSQKVVDIVPPAEVDLSSLKRLIAQINANLRRLEKRVQALEKASG